MPARAFVLLDALPKREQDVFNALDKVSGVVSKRMLPQRAGQGDILVLVEAADDHGLERLLTNEMRSVHGVHNVIRVRADATVLGPLQRLMTQMHAEVEARGKG